MYNDSVNEFEKFSGMKSGEISGEQAERAAEWDAAMSGRAGGEVPDFAGNEYGIAKPANKFYGETVSVEAEAGEEYNKGISDAAALINYGLLNAAAKEKGVEHTVQTIKGFDASGRENPIRDLFVSLGVDTPEESREIRDEASALKVNENAFREGVNAPSEKKSVEGAFAAIDDMKELISEVEGADPRYEELRLGARAAGKGYFEYAVSEFGVQDLTTLFRVLAEQREKKDEEMKDSKELDSEEQGEYLGERGDGEAEEEAVEKLEEMRRRGEVENDAA